MSGLQLFTEWAIYDVDEADYGEITTDEAGIRRSWAQGITWWDPDGAFELRRREVMTYPGIPRLVRPWQVVERSPNAEGEVTA